MDFVRNVHGMRSDALQSSGGTTAVGVDELDRLAAFLAGVWDNERMIHNRLLHFRKAMRDRGWSAKFDKGTTTPIIKAVPATDIAAIDRGAACSVCDLTQKLHSYRTKNAAMKVALDKIKSALAGASDAEL